MATFRRGHSSRNAHRHNARQLTKLTEQPPQNSPYEEIDPRRNVRLKHTTPDQTDRLSRTTRGRLILQLIHTHGTRCYLCGEELDQNYQVDHIIPRAHGGEDDSRNFALTCRPCNSRKRDLIVSFTVQDRTPCFWLPR